MTDSTPKVVGIMIPCYNQGQYLVECIDSLYRQTYPHWRAVVIDDASTDGTSPRRCQEAASAKVRAVLLDKNLGISLIRNEGVKQLGAVDYILNVDCDDYISETFVEKLVDGLDSSPKAGFAYGVLHFFGDSDSESNGETFPDREWSRETMYLENLIPASQTMFKYECLAQIEGWRADFTRCSGEDYDIWLQAVEAGWEPLWVKDAVYFYRRHAGAFMKRLGRNTALEIETNILKNHYRGIERSVGVERYLNQRLLPEIYGSIRAGEIRRVVELAYPLLRICPSRSLRSITKYYAKRLYLRLAG